METFKGFTILRISHFIIWLTWLTLTLISNSFKNKYCFDTYFNKFVNYDFFRSFELVFMFGGGILLFIFLTNVVKLKYWNYIIFEFIFIIIVVIKLVIYFC
jgi:hypothetical protein